MPAPLLALAAVSVVATATAPAPSLVGLIQTPELSDPAISPDGRFVAYRRTEASVQANGYSVSWWIAPLTTKGPARKIAEGGGAIWNSGGMANPEPPQWSPDSQRFYYRALVGGAVQVWRASLDGAAPRAVVVDGADVEAFQLLDKDHLVYRTGATRAAILKAEADQAAHGVRIDKTVDVVQDLTRSGIVNGRLAAERLTGDWFDRTSLLGDAPRRFTVVDLDGHGAHPAYASEVAALSHPNFLQARLAPTQGDLDQVAKLDGGSRLTVSSGLRRVATQAFENRIAAFRWRPDHNQLVVTTIDPARRETLWLWDIAYARLRRLIKADGVLNDNAGWARGACPLNVRVTVCVAASPLVPTHLVRIDLDTGRALDLDPAKVPPGSGQLIQARTLTWEDDKGHHFGGVLMTPPAQPKAARMPLFITYYQCPGYLRGGTGDEWPLAPLAARGIATLCINETADEPDPGNAVEAYQLALSGIEAIVARLDDDGMIDRARIGMGGLSFGSEVTMWVATHSDLLAAASLATPNLEPVYYWFNGVAGRPHHATLEKTWGLGDPDLTRAAWARVSPALQTDRIHTALLMQLSEQEFRYQMELYAKLTNSPVPADMFVFPDEPHNLVEPVHRLAVYQRNIDWFAFWLKDEIDPDPAKALQYQRLQAQKRAWLASPQAPQARSHISTSTSSSSR